MHAGRTRVAGGRRVGPVLTAFGVADVKPNLDLSSREYFQALKADRAWRVSDDYHHTVRVVAQRLFKFGSK